MHPWPAETGALAEREVAFPGDRTASASGVLNLELGGGWTNDSIYRGSRDKRNVTSVKITTEQLDTLSERYFGDHTIDLCKVDIEGAEEEVFLSPGHESTLSRTNALAIEIHHARTSRRVAEAICKSGLRWVAGNRKSGEHGQHLFARSSCVAAGCC